MQKSTNFIFTVSYQGRDNVLSHLGLRNVYVGKMLNLVSDSTLVDIDEKTKTSKPSRYGYFEFYSDKNLLIKLDTENPEHLEKLYELLSYVEKDVVVTPRIYHIVASML